MIRFRIWISEINLDADWLEFFLLPEILRIIRYSQTIECINAIEFSILMGIVCCDWIEFAPILIIRAICGWA